MSSQPDFSGCVCAVPLSPTDHAAPGQPTLRQGHVPAVRGRCRPGFPGCFALLRPTCALLLGRTAPAAPTVSQVFLYLFSAPQHPTCALLVGCTTFERVPAVNSQPDSPGWFWSSPYRYLCARSYCALHAQCTTCLFVSWRTILLVGDQPTGRFVCVCDLGLSVLPCSQLPPLLV